MTDDIEDTGDDGAAEARVALEKEARLYGWAPKEQWKGDPAIWKDADEYVEYGRNVMPVLRANNARLLGELESTKKAVAGLKGNLDQQNQVMKDILEHQASEIKRQVESRLSSLRSEKKAAIREGDHERAADLDEEIDKTKDALTAAPPPAPAKKEEPTSGIPQDIEPYVREFTDSNKDWLQVDKRKTALFMAICEELYADGKRGEVVLQEGKKLMEETLSPRSSRAAKSEGGNGGWTGGGKGKEDSSFDSLPADAKAVAKSQAAKFVGENKPFKTTAEWNAYYAKTYTESQVR